MSSKSSAAILAAVALFVGSCSTQKDIAVWPVAGDGNQWPISSPESQGVSSATLDQMLRRIITDEILIDSIHVIKNGFLILDAYRYPYIRGALHAVHSCTKSVVSTLVGMAVDEGDIKGASAKLNEIFPGTPVAADLELKHLLTMTTGLRSRDSYLYRWEGLHEMRASDNWAAFALSRPQEAAPGTRFDYSNQSSFLLSAALQRATGQSAADYAVDKLFFPLGIEEFEWPANERGITLGWDGLMMHPLDLARIGLLYLRNGEWSGDQLIPKVWIREATDRHITANTNREFYGYQWWVDRSGTYMALGYAGQYLIVNPDLDLVVVFTSALPEPHFFVPWDLYSRYIENSAPASDPVDLSAMVEAFSAAPASHPPRPSALQETIDGVEYLLESNRLGMTGITITFADEIATVTEHYEGQSVDHVAGLDGRYRLNNIAGQGTVAVRGEWIDQFVFAIDYHSVGGAWHTRLELKYAEDRVEGEAIGNSGNVLPLAGVTTGT